MRMKGGVWVLGCFFFKMFLSIVHVFFLEFMSLAFDLNQVTNVLAAI